MPLTITKARLSSITVEWNNGTPKITGKYSMVSDKDVNVTVQSFNEYSDKRMEFSRDVLDIARELLDAIEYDIEVDTGIKDIVNKAVQEIKGGE